MFTGIVQGVFKVSQICRSPGLLQYSVELPDSMLENLRIGASVAVDGVCQTVVKIQKNNVYFDAIQETLDRTTLNNLKEGQPVNIERAARFGDEIGGHIVSGHVFGKIQVSEIKEEKNNRLIKFSCNSEWIKYLFTKGFVAIDGVSLTLTDVRPEGSFVVHLIPETLRMTQLGKKQVGDWVNLEFESQTQAIVETVERVLARKGIQ